MNPQRTSLPGPEHTGEPNAPKVSHMLELTPEELERLHKALELFRLWATLHRPPNRPDVNSILKKVSDLRTGIES